MFLWTTKQLLSSQKDQGVKLRLGLVTINGETFDAKSHPGRHPEA
jgi:hypothetical protein